MTEYEARGTTARINDAELILTPIRGNAAQREALTRRIPYGAIREVIFRESRLSDSVLTLVLGGTDRAAKLGAWGADANPDSLAFKPGKQAKGARELQRRLDAEVAASRAKGISAGAVPYDLPATGEEVLRDINHRKLDPSELRDDVALAAKSLTDVPKRIRTLLAAVVATLLPGESVEALTSGAVGSAIANYPGLLVLTDHRVFILSAGASAVTDELRRGSIESVTWHQGIVGKLDIAGDGRFVTLRALDAGATGPLVELLRSVTMEQSQPARITDVDQLERLVALLDRGVLTRPEFEEQKAKLLKN